MPTTDPDEWGRICAAARGPGYVFRRAIELAQGISREFVQSGQRWLDVGCGTGGLLESLVEAGASASGVDADPRMIAVARRRLPSPPPLALAHAEQLPFGAETIDGVTATSFMGCVADADAVFAEIRRVLKSGGHAVITFTNRDSWLLRLNYARGPRGGSGYRLYRASQLREDLKSLGFDIVRVRFYGFVLTAGTLTVPPARAARRFECSGPEWLVTRLARNFIVVVRKVTP